MYCLSKLHDNDDNIVFKYTGNQVFVSSMHAVRMGNNQLVLFGPDILYKC